MSEKRWPVSDRDEKPLWFHLLNYACAIFLGFCLLVLLLAAIEGWVHVLP